MTSEVIDINRELILLSLQGDRAAQSSLYNQYSKAMYHICLRMTNNKEEAEDILIESFTDAFSRLHTFRFESSFGAWLKRVVVNHCINMLKKRKIDLMLVDDMEPWEKKTESYDADHDSEMQLTVEKIHKAVEQLPEGARVVLSLYLFEGYDHAEIASILNVSESASKTQYMRARIRVAELVKNMK